MVEPALQYLVVSMATVDKCYIFKGELLSASVYRKKDVVFWGYNDEVGFFSPFSYSLIRDIDV